MKSNITSFSKAMRHFRKEGLSPTQMECLLFVNEKPGTTAGDLAKDCGVTKATMTTALAVLVKGGYLFFEEDINDRRYRYCQLTRKGRAFVREVIDILEDV